MKRPRIIYAQRSDATSDAEVSALANVYKFVLDCHAKKAAATSPVSRPNDGTIKIKEDDSANDILPHQL
jgi:hypothetical protein